MTKPAVIKKKLAELYFYKRPRISIRGSVRPWVRPSVTIKEQAPAGHKMRLAGSNRPFRRFRFNTDGRTDIRTDGPTDRPSYRDARTPLKTAENGDLSLD